MRVLNRATVVMLSSLAVVSASIAIWWWSNQQLLPRGDSAASRPTVSRKKFPAIFPEENFASIVSRYGKPVKQDPFFKTWAIGPFTVSIIFSDDGLARSISFTHERGLRVNTPDGVELYKTTLAEFRRQFAGAIDIQNEDFGAEEGHVWYLFVPLHADKVHPYQRNYAWYLNDGVPSDKALIDRFDPPAPGMFDSVAVSGYSTDRAK